MHSIFFYFALLSTDSIFMKFIMESLSLSLLRPVVTTTTFILVLVSLIFLFALLSRVFFFFVSCDNINFELRPLSN